MEFESEEEHDEAIDVAEAMMKYGGSFVKALGQALIHADVFNRLKIKDIWPEYWAEFLKFAKKEK